MPDVVGVVKGRDRVRISRVALELRASGSAREWDEAVNVEVVALLLTR